MLQKMGAHFESSVNGLQALETYKTSPDKFDIILMDCEMPEMDGYTATKKIRQFEKMQNIKPIPILALTAHATSNTEKKCLDVGMNAHIPKPIKLQQITTDILHFVTKKDSKPGSNIIKLNPHS